MMSVRAGMVKGSLITALMLLAAETYSVLRYHIAGTWPWSDLWLFTTNKALALSSVSLLSLLLVMRPLSAIGFAINPGVLKAQRILSRAALVLAMLHVMFSFLLLGPHYYPGLFGADGSVNTTGGWSILAGVFTLLLFWLFQRLRYADKIQARGVKKYLRLVEKLLPAGAALHAGILGFNGWLKPSVWPGGMPPITLLSVGVLAVGITLALSVPVRNK